MVSMEEQLEWLKESGGDADASEEILKKEANEVKGLFEKAFRLNEVPDVTAAKLK